MKVQDWSSSIEFKSKEGGKSLLCGGLNKIIQLFLRSSRANGGVVNTAVAISVKGTLTKRYRARAWLCTILNLWLGLEIYSIIWDL